MAEQEREGDPSVWLASDSRLSNGGRTLIESGVKVYEIPVIVRAPGPERFFDQISVATSIGVGCAGHTLIFQNVCQTLTSAFANLGAFEGQPPTLRDLARFAASVTRDMVSQLAELRADAHGVGLILAGVDPSLKRPMAYELRPTFTADAYPTFEGFDVVDCDLDAGASFIGEYVEAAESRLAKLIDEAEHPVARERAPLQVIREFIADDSKPSIGGSLELGLTDSGRFRRVATVEPLVRGEPAAAMLLNGCRIDDMAIGPCFVGISALA